MKKQAPEPVYDEGGIRLPLAEVLNPGSTGRRWLTRRRPKLPKSEKGPREPRLSHREPPAGVPKVPDDPHVPRSGGGEITKALAHAHSRAWRAASLSAKLNGKTPDELLSAVRSLADSERTWENVQEKKALDEREAREARYKAAREARQAERAR
jgi:hypothetical protein